MKQCGNMPCVLIYMYVQLFNSENLRSWGWMPFKIVSFSPSCSGCLFYLYFFSFFVLLGGKDSCWIFFFCWGFFVGRKEIVWWKFVCLSDGLLKKLYNLLEEIQFFHGVLWIMLMIFEVLVHLMAISRCFVNSWEV